ncbi:MAG: T9SS type A sorting domain-containing protein, partial [Saprospiraceae bacterium]
FIDFHKAFFFRDSEHYYAFLSDYGHYISPVDNIVWTPLETTQTGSDYLVHDNVVYLGGEGMYASEILDPFITKTNEPSYPISISVFPVPAKDFLNISLNEHEFSGTIHFLLYDANGRLVKSLISEPGPNIMMNIRDISPGIYFLKAQTSGKIGVVKIVKQ